MQAACGVITAPGILSRLFSFLVLCMLSSHPVCGVKVSVVG